MSNWKPINTAPKLLRGYICAWNPDWDRPCILIYKTNDRFKGSEWEGVKYYGDPDESDDYALCNDDSEKPTHWMDIAPLPAVL